MSWSVSRLNRFGLLLMMAIIVFSLKPALTSRTTAALVRTTSDCACARNAVDEKPDSAASSNNWPAGFFKDNRNLVLIIFPLRLHQLPPAQASSVWPRCDGSDS